MLSVNMASVDGYGLPYSNHHTKQPICLQLYILVVVCIQQNVVMLSTYVMLIIHTGGGVRTANCCHAVNLRYVNYTYWWWCAYSKLLSCCQLTLC